MTEKIQCPHCDKKFTKMGISTHIWRVHGEGQAHDPNKNRVAWNKGLTKDTDERVAKTGACYSAGIKEGRITSGLAGKKRSPETCRKLSENMNARYAAGWQSGGGRCKKYVHFSDIAGEVKIDGKWELAVCIYFDTLDIHWKRNTERFPYKKPNNKDATYCPDFFVEEWDSYIEIKGYETDIDKCKWRDFPIDKKLIIWRKEDLLKMKIL